MGDISNVQRNTKMYRNEEGGGHMVNHVAFQFLRWRGKGVMAFDPLV